MANYKYTEAEEEKRKNKHCRTCQYRMSEARTLNGQTCCEYIIITGKRIGCPASECTHYMDGKMDKKYFNHKRKL